MRLLIPGLFGVSVALATAAAMPSTRPPVPAAPMDADDGRAPPPVATERDYLNDHEAQARVLVLCGLISTDDYQAEGAGQSVRRERIGALGVEDVKRDREYIEGEVSVLAQHSCNEVAVTSYARAWWPLGGAGR